MWFWGLRFLVFAAMAVAILSGAVMYLWNAILPDVLGVMEITWLQALGILALSRILFGGWGRGGRWGGGHPRHRGWKRHWMERWNEMSEEEKEAMKRKWAQQGGPWGRGRGCQPSTETPEAQEVTEEKS